MLRRFWPAIGDAPLGCNSAQPARSSLLRSRSRLLHRHGCGPRRGQGGSRTAIPAFGVVAYASGRLGNEPVRSQGHVHAIAPHCGWSTPELFEIWEGSAIIYAQESDGDDPGRCVAIMAHAGEQVVVPPGWAHCVINASAAGVWSSAHAANGNMVSSMTESARMAGWHGFRFSVKMQNSLGT